MLKHNLLVFAINYSEPKVEPQTNKRTAPREDPVFGLPANIDLTFFIARRLLQVCVGANEIILNFDDELSLTIESDIRHSTSAGEVRAFSSSVKAAATLVRLIECTVETAYRIEPGALALRFSNGETLEVLDSNAEYESYQIRHRQRFIVV